MSFARAPRPRLQHRATVTGRRASVTERSTSSPVSLVSLSTSVFALPRAPAGRPRDLIVRATREKRFVPRAVRIDSTVIEADVKHPTDAGLAGPGVRSLVREGRRLAKLIGEKPRGVRDRSRSMGKKLRGGIGVGCSG